MGGGTNWIGFAYVFQYLIAVFLGPPFYSLMIIRDPYSGVVPISIHVVLDEGAVCNGLRSGRERERERGGQMTPSMGGFTKGEGKGEARRGKDLPDSRSFMCS